MGFLFDAIFYPRETYDERQERKHGICLKCKGTGKVETGWDPREEGSYDIYYGPCPRCGGTGKV